MEEKKQKEFSCLEATKNDMCQNCDKLVVCITDQKVEENLRYYKKADDNPINDWFMDLCAKYNSGNREFSIKDHTENHYVVCLVKMKASVDVNAEIAILDKEIAELKAKKEEEKAKSAEPEEQKEQGA